MEDYLNEKQMHKLLELVEIIDSHHALDLKLLDFISPNNYRHFGDTGLLDDKYLLKGNFSAKGLNNQPTKTNLVFYYWLSIMFDLKAFGLNKVKLIKIKDYLFEELSILDFIGTDPNSLLKDLDTFEFKDMALKTELVNNIKSGGFTNKLKDKKVSLLFLSIFNLMSTMHDIQLVVDKEANAMIVDEFELSKEDILNLAKDSRIIIPLKQYLVNFITNFTNDAFLTRSKILNAEDIKILKELERNDIERVTIKFHKGRPNIMEVKKLKKIEIQARLSEILLKGGYEDIIIKTQNGTILYSEQINKVKL